MCAGDMLLVLCVSSPSKAPVTKHYIQHCPPGETKPRCLQEELVEAVRSAIEETLMGACDASGKRSFTQVRGWVTGWAGMPSCLLPCKRLLAQPLLLHQPAVTAGPPLSFPGLRICPPACLPAHFAGLPAACLSPTRSNYFESKWTSFATLK